MSARKGDRFLVVKQYPWDEVPRRLCNTLKQARSVAAAYCQSSKPTKTDERLADAEIIDELCSVAIYRIDADGHVSKLVQIVS